MLSAGMLSLLYHRWE